MWGGGWKIQSEPLFNPSIQLIALMDKKSAATQTEGASSVFSLSLHSLELLSICLFNKHGVFTALVDTVAPFPLPSKAQDLVGIASSLISVCSAGWSSLLRLMIYYPTDSTLADE